MVVAIAVDMVAAIGVATAMAMNMVRVMAADIG